MARRKIALLIENIKDSGGNREIFRLFKSLSASTENRVSVLVLARDRSSLKDFGGHIRDVVFSKAKYRGASAVKSQKQIIYGGYDLVISTSRRTLNFVGAFDAPWHLHFMQHIEAWASLNSEIFRRFCIDSRYPNPQECVALIRNIGIAEDIAYLGQLSRTRNFRAVSPYLAEIARALSPDASVEIAEPKPHILPAIVADLPRSIDVMMFLRGLKFKGDDLNLAVAKSLAARSRRLAIVCTPKTAPLVDDIAGRSNVEIYTLPSNETVGRLYQRAKIVLHPSLCEGFGSIPQEALAIGCDVLASRSGWVGYGERPNRLHIMDVHSPEEYITKIEAILA
jgi:glycosyltransferase involved in cell wall biosynthesis